MTVRVNELVDRWRQGECCPRFSSGVRSFAMHSSTTTTPPWANRLVRRESIPAAGGRPTTLYKTRTRLPVVVVFHPVLGTRMHRTPATTTTPAFTTSSCTKGPIIKGVRQHRISDLACGLSGGNKFPPGPGVPLPPVPDPPPLLLVDRVKSDCRCSVRGRVRGELSQGQDENGLLRLQIRGEYSSRAKIDLKAQA